MITIAILLNWLRLFEVLSISSSVGPLIQMVIQMLKVDMVHRYLNFWFCG